MKRVRVWTMNGGWEDEREEAAVAASAQVRQEGAQSDAVRSERPMDAQEATGAQRQEAGKDPRAAGGGETDGGTKAPNPKIQVVWPGSTCDPVELTGVEVYADGILVAKNRSLWQ
jgi:hypothetical protein